MSALTSETVATLSDDTLKKVKDLARVNIDSSKGFCEASDSLTNTTLASYFKQWSEDRQENAEELQQVVTINAEEPPEEGSWMAAFHRSWLAVRTALSSNDDLAVLEEAERGEDYIKEAYEDALKETAGSAVNDVLQKQYSGVKAVHDTVRDLRNTRRKAK